MNEFIYSCICLWPLCTFLSLATHLLHKTFSRWIDFGSVKENQSRIKFQRQLTLKLLEFSLFFSCVCKKFYTNRFEWKQLKASKNHLSLTANCRWNDFFSAVFSISSRYLKLSLYSIIWFTQHFISVENTNIHTTQKYFSGYWLYNVKKLTHLLYKIWWIDLKKKFWSRKRRGKGSWRQNCRHLACLLFLIIVAWWID